ncbi:NUMOD4 motif-containing HNH endonuclease [bacterium]|nr:NUMOD4 motif-containing HNH endonuclease [bacterium]
MDTNQASAQEQANDIFYYSKMSQLGIEEWKPIPGYEQAYDVSNMGRVKSLVRKVKACLKHQDYRQVSGKVLATTNDKQDRPIVNLSWQGQQSTFTVHKLVALAFLGVRPNGLAICHNNGKASDNRLFNLRYDTHVNNHKDKEKHGTKLEGERHGCAKITNEEAAQIIKLLKDGQLTHAAIVKRVPSAIISIVRHISKGKTWRSIDTAGVMVNRKKQEGERHDRAKITSEEATQVIQLLKDRQLTHAQIVELVPSATIHIVRDISSGRTWKSLTA